MSRISDKRAKEILEDLNKHEVIMFENTNNEAESEYTNVELHQALDIAIESLDNEWVDVRDRLPSDEKEYLICDNEQLMYVSSYEKFKDGTKKWVDDYGEELTDGIRPIKIIAWKPLPQSYERKE